MTAATDTAVESGMDHAHDDDHDHPSDLFYLKIAGVLAFFTALEVGTYFLEGDVSEGLLIAGLTILMIIKFAMVAAYFMHLKYDTKWFTYVFVAGLVLALAVYAIFFSAFDVFGLG